MIDYWRAMGQADEYAEHSRCNSIHRGCLLLDEEGKFVSVGFNDTVDPVCLAGICHKRKLGEEHGSGVFCQATHAEQMAAGIAMTKGLRAHTAVCNFSTMPCTMCLSNLYKAGVKKIVLLDSMDFYNYNDQLMWEHQYQGLMEVEVWHRRKASEADKQ